MQKSARSLKTGRRMHAQTFAALGDETRLGLLTELGKGAPRSITQLTDGTRLTRQAITKHLRLLERVRLVRCVRTGRESLFVIDPQPMLELNEYLALVSQQWEGALSRLKAFAESREA